MIQILDLLGVYFDAVVVEVKTFLLLFRLPLAILCTFKNIGCYGVKLDKPTNTSVALINIARH